MAKFSQGFMDVLSRTGTPQAAMQQGQQEAPAYGSLQRNLGAAFNMDQRSRPEMASAEIDKIDPNSKDALRQSLLVSAKYEQDQQRKLLMLAKVAELDQEQEAKNKALRKEQQMRESAAERARAVGLTGVAVGIEAGNPLDKALELVRDEEKRRLLVTQGKTGRLALLKQAGATQSEVEGMLDAPEEAFMAFLNGNEGDIGAFVDTKNNNTIVSLRKNSYGRVWDDAEQRWKNPSEMGIAPAPQLQEIYNRGDDLVKGMVDLGIKSFGELQKKADGATQTLQTTKTALEYLDSEKGIYTGVFGELFKEADKWAYALSGGNWDQSKAANSEAYVASRIFEVATQITAFGTGSAVSDTDREYVTSAVGGSLKMTEEAIRSILRQGVEASEIILASHKDAVDTLASEGVPPNLLNLISISQRFMPEEKGNSQPTKNWQDYLNQRRGGQ